MSEEENKVVLSSTQEETARFDIGSEEAKAYFDEYGYVVLKSALTPEECQVATDLFWQFVESLGRGIERTKPDTWHNWPGWTNTGILFGDGVGQSEFLWFVRGIPRVKRAFEQLWFTDKLFTSFDGCGAFRPWQYDPSWKTNSGWWHVDQNPWAKPKLTCVQGLVSMFDATPATGGFCVTPGSHHSFTKLGLRERGGDFIRIPPGHYVLDTPAKLVTCKAGDMVLWDSRTVHCNCPATETPTKPADDDSWQLLRLVAYICMTPTHLASHLIELRQNRKQAFLKRTTTNHWPHEFHVASELSAKSTGPRRNPLQLNAQQRALLFGLGQDEEYEDRDV